MEKQSTDISHLVETEVVDVLAIPEQQDLGPMELPLRISDLTLERLSELVSVVELVVIDMIQKKIPLKASAIAAACRIHPVQFQRLVRMHEDLKRLMDDSAAVLAAEAEEELERLAHQPERCEMNDKGTSILIPNASQQRIKALEALLIGRHPSYKRTIDTTVNHTTNIFEKGSNARILNVQDAQNYFMKLRSGGAR